MLTAIEIYNPSIYVPTLTLPIIGTNDTGRFHIKNVEGLGPTKANINSKGYGSLNGEYFTGSNVGKRNIVFTLGLNPGFGDQSPAATRRFLYGYLAPQIFMTLGLVSDDRGTIKIDGYVEGIEPNLFSKDPEVQVSIICPSPYFRTSTLFEVTGVANASPTGVTFDYGGNITTGVMFELHADGNDYSDSVLIETGNVDPPYKKFETVPNLSSISYYRIDARQGVKTVENAHETTNAHIKNLLGSMTDESIWPYVNPGTNSIRVTTTTGPDRPWSLKFFERFGGI